MLSTPMDHPAHGAPLHSPDGVEYVNNTAPPDCYPLDLGNLQHHPHPHHHSEFAPFPYLDSPTFPPDSPFRLQHHQPPISPNYYVPPQQQWPAHAMPSPGLTTPTTPHFPPQPMPAAPAPQLAPAPVLNNAPAPATTSSHPRRTLTDADRRRMCIFHTENPTVKQTEIGVMFGVERSTVSKVLRQKEKYMFPDDGSRSPIKRSGKGKFPDIERALSVWARNTKKQGGVLTDEKIREKARFFAMSVGVSEGQFRDARGWLEKFKAKNGLGGGVAVGANGGLGGRAGRGRSESDVTGARRIRGGTPFLSSLGGEPMGLSRSQESSNSPQSATTVEFAFPDGYGAGSTSSPSPGPFVGRPRSHTLPGRGMGYGSPSSSAEAGTPGAQGMPSQMEAKMALEVVMSYLRMQPGMVERDEFMVVGKLLGKLGIGDQGEGHADGGSAEMGGADMGGAEMGGIEMGYGVEQGQPQGMGMMEELHQGMEESVEVKPERSFSSSG